MKYTTRTVTSSEGLSQTEALISLQEHPEFKSGTRITGIYNQGGRWIAKLEEPKVANENPFEEDIKESPAELHEEKHEEHEEHEKSESPLEELKEHEGEDHEDHEDSEEKKIKQLEKKIDLLLDALGISEKGEEPKLPEAPEAPAADLPAAPAPKGGPAKSDPLPPGSGAKLKPGEVPNKPGMTPVGAPAFASVKTAGCDGSCDEGSCEHCDKQRKEATSVPPNAVGMSATDSASTAPESNKSNCARCGGSDPSCTQCSGQTVASFTASRLDPERKLTIRQAKAGLENEFKGFKVSRIKRDGDYLHALISR